MAWLRNSAAAGVGALVASLLAAPAAATDCSALLRATASLPTIVHAAETIAASTAQPWTSPPGLIGTAQVTAPFCRVTASVHPTPNSDIRFELWLPLRWNGRFFGTASGGSAGSISYVAMADPLVRGYAAMGHDNGHVSGGFEQDWAFDAHRGQVNTDKVIDFAWRAQHAATVAAKDLTRAFYAKQPARSYYVGCSQGGHHGLMEAQRFPDDYDAIVAGAHGGDWIGVLTAEAWAAYQVTRDQRAGGIPKALLPAVGRQVLASCDAADGAADGSIENPQRCRPDLAALRCRPGQAEACLTEAQIAATQAIHAGPREAAGPIASSGYAPGSELNWATTWNAETVARSGSYFDFFRLVARQQPDWDFQSFAWPDEVIAARARWSAVYDAREADLARFKARGGRLILYHGWSDGLVPAGQTLHYWDRLQQAMGAAGVAEFARLFMVPGMGHCAGGPIGSADWLTAMENWVEKGQAPDPGSRNPIVGSGALEDGTKRRRTYCPWPQTARYRGSGDLNAPESFTCAAS